MKCEICNIIGFSLNELLPMNQRRSETLQKIKHLIQVHKELIPNGLCPKCREESK